MSSSDYSLLQLPLDIKGVTIPSRIVRTSHGGGPGASGVAYHTGPAKSGVGLSFFSVGGVHPSIGPPVASTPASYKEYEETLRELHKYPMKMFQQLWHSGRSFATAAGQPPFGASVLPGPRVSQSDQMVLPVAVTKLQIAEFIEYWVAAAKRVVEAGIDGVEIHSAHGYFLSSFLSPIQNVREDEYGGSLENRMRFVTEILTAVRAEVGRFVPVGMRISANEMVPGGLSTEEACEVVRRLDQAGLIDYLSVSLGSPMNYPKVIGGMEEPHGYELPYSERVAASVSVPAIVGGRITTLAEAEEVLSRGNAQFVSMVRAHIADPELVAKTLAGRTPRPCVACNQGCVGAAGSPGHRFGCAVNPAQGWTDIENTSTRETPLKVLIVGGGPAGMEAARTAAERGDHVVLCEASDELGGQLRYARRAPARAEWGRFSDWLVGELDALKVDVRLNTNVTQAYVEKKNPDRVIIATGSVPRRDGMQGAEPTTPVDGIDSPHVHTVWDVLRNDSFAPKRVLIFEDVGHHEGVSAAEALLARGSSVTFVTRLNRLIPLLEFARMESTIKERLLPQDFTFIPDYKLGRIGEKEVTIVSLYGAPDQVIATDAVVFVGINEPVRELAAQLGGRPGVHVVGDAWGQRFLQLAMTEAHQAAMAD